MDKQIKELATEILQEFTSCYSEADEDCLVEMIRKYIPEGAVVLTREEYDGLKISKDFDYGYHNGERNMTAYYENIRLPEVRKKTAEKFAERLKPALQEWLEDNEGIDGKINFGIATIELIGVKSLDGEVIAESLIDEIAKEFTGEENGKSNKP